MKGRRSLTVSGNLVFNEGADSDSDHSSNDFNFAPSNPSLHELKSSDLVANKVKKIYKKN